MGDAGRPTEFSIEKAYSLLRQDTPPVWTAADLAEEMGVSATTVRNNLNRLTSRPGVRTQEIGRTTVYYYTLQGSLDDRRITADDEFPDLFNPEEEIAKARGKWEWAVKRATSVKRYDEISARMWLHSVLVDVVEVLNREAASISYDLLVSERYPAGDGEPGSNEGVEVKAIDSKEWDLSEEEIRYYLTETELYQSTADGPIRGFAFLETESPAHNLTNEDGVFDASEIPNEQLDAQLPSFGEVLEAGEVWQEFVTELFDWRW